MVNSSLEEKANRFLLALYQVRQEQHPQLSEEEIAAGSRQGELTVQVSKTMPILGVENQDKFIQLVAEAVPYLFERGLVTDLWSRSTNGYIGGLKLTEAGIRHAEYLTEKE